MRSTFRCHRRPARGIASLIALAVVLGPFRSIANAQEPAIRLWQGRAPEARGDSVIDQPSLTPFLAPTAKANGTAIVIFPGGGYQHLAIDKEGNDVARWLNGLGVSPSAALVRLMSNETRVTAQTPPAFIVATTDDATVPVQNSVMFYDALLATKVPVELHIFEAGRHGFGLAPADPVLSTWLSLCEAWMRRHDWVR
jgi:acetyl esterase/lipase